MADPFKAHLPVVNQKAVRVPFRVYSMLKFLKFLMQNYGSRKASPRRVFAGVAPCQTRTSSFGGGGKGMCSYLRPPLSHSLPILRGIPARSGVGGCLPSRGVSAFGSSRFKGLRGS